MNEPDPSSVIEAPASRPSLSAQLVEMSSAPADLYTELRPLPASAGTGFAVVCLTVLIAILGNFTLLISKGALEDIYRRQQKSMEQKVEQGSMTAAQASRGIEQMRSFSPALFLTIGAVAASIFTMIASVFWALVVFLGAKVLGGQPISFVKAYEISGLAFVVLILGGIVGIGLILLRDSLASPSGALFVEDFDPGNKLHNFLQALNPFSIWFVAVLGVGLACTSGVPLRKALIALLGFWIVTRLILVLSGQGVMA